MPANTRRFAQFVERAGHRIPDPVIIFMAFDPLAFLAIWTALLVGFFALGIPLGI